MTASDYPVTFGYGATDGLYYAASKSQSSNPSLWIGPYHRGDDRAMPMRTPVVVNGITVGLSGNGGGEYEPHLHVGKFVNGADVDPQGQGFSLDGAVVFDILDNFSDPVNGKYVRIKDASGALWVYLHMDAVSVTPGQQLIKQGDTTPMTDKNFVTAMFIDLFNTAPTQAQIDQYVNRPFPDVYNELRSSLPHQQWVAYVQQVIKDNDNRAAQITDLQAKLAATGGSEPSQDAVDAQNYRAMKKALGIN